MNELIEPVFRALVNKKGGNKMVRSKSRTDTNFVFFEVWWWPILDDSQIRIVHIKMSRSYTNYLFRVHNIFYEFIDARKMNK